jgi:O-succinylbenzoic acid--CoA ligase
VRVSLVPTQVRDMAAAGLLPVLARCDAVLIGAAATPPDLEELLVEHRVKYYSTYGMTESAGGVVWNGEALPGVSISIESDGPAAGTITIGGPTVALGYRGRPDLTAGQFTISGTDRAFRTSDLGRLESADVLSGQRLIITGRTDDVVQVAGTSVSLKAVEAVLQLHPDIEEIAIAGVPDERLGTRVVAVVVVSRLAPRGAELTAALRDAVEQSLGRVAAPRDVVVVDALPMLESGKVDRVTLAKLAETSVPSD